jgi:hypothetical protein
MIKPIHLFHGRRYLVESLSPTQAFGFGGAADCQKAVYAVAEREWAIPFAITFTPTASDATFTIETESSPPSIRLKNTEVMWYQKGYLYTLPSGTFERIDEKQWVSYYPVKPEMIEEINPQDYRDWMVFEVE